MKHRLEMLLVAPVSSRSGYGNHSRDIAQSLIDMDRFEIKIIDIRWGSCPRNALTREQHQDIVDRLFYDTNLSTQPDVTVQITVPNEFQPIGKYNIGITAGVETNLCSPEWIDGLNKMNLTIATSEHTKNVFVKTEWNKNIPGQQPVQIKCNRPVETLFEGIDRSIYNKTSNIETSVRHLLKNVKESFNFLYVGHWLKGELGHDRKDTGMLIKTFLETFKNMKDAPGLIMKTSGATFSMMERQQLVDKVNTIKNMVEADRLPNIYIVHGDLTDKEMNSLVNHSKVKAHITFTKGEGFCVKNYTKVYTETGLKRIDEIRLGEKVLTHTGNFKPVTNLMKREYNGNMYNINTHGSFPLEKMLFTPNHNIMTFDKLTHKFSWKSAEKITTEDYLCFPINKNNEEVKQINIMDFIENYKVKVNQYSKLSDSLFLENGIINYTHSDKTDRINEIPNSLSLDKNFGKLVGYYLAEGCVSKGSVVFSLHENEQYTLGKEIIDSMRNCFGINRYRVINYNDKQSVSLVFESKIVAEFIKNICGTKKDKYINNVFTKAPDDFKTNLITSLMLGDGHVSNKTIEISLVNDFVLRSIRLMLFNQKIVSSYLIMNKDQLNKRKSLKYKFNGDVHRLRISNNSSYNKLISMINNNHFFCDYDKNNMKRENYIGGRSPFIVDDNIVFPIKNIQIEQENDFVYNISVEEDESYCLENFVVHNCRPLLEASLTEKPIIASGWSGQLDFLPKDLAVLLPGNLQPVHESARWDKVILGEAKWFYVNYTYASHVMKQVFNNYRTFIPNAKKLAMINSQKFTLDKMREKLEAILDQYLPKFAENVPIQLPKLKKVGSEPEPQKLSLPKLKKVE